MGRHTLFLLISAFLATETSAFAQSQQADSRRKFHGCVERVLGELIDNASYRNELRKRAEDMILELQKKFERRLSAAGYSNYEQFLAALRSSEDPNIQRALKLVDDGRITPAIHAPDGTDRRWDMRLEDSVLTDPDIRLRISHQGLQNNYVTGKSRGDARFDVRTEAEAGYLGLRGSKSYFALPHELKPKSGTIYFKDVHLSSYPFPARRYGADLWFPKPQTYRRMGIYPGDTLNQLYLMPEPVRGVLNTGAISELYIPWKYRHFMVPFIAGGLKRGDANLPYLLDGWFPKVKPYLDHHWWETQFFGPLTLDDMDQFMFLNEPPSGEFLSRLRQYKIQILDGRVQPPKVWDGKPE